MSIEWLYPSERIVPYGKDAMSQLSDRVQRSRESLQEPFSDDLIEFFSLLSDALFAANRKHQFRELQALAFWMRKSALVRMRDQFLKSLNEEILPTPRGVSFHVTPSNVDTMPIYSLLLSLICGNSNVVRVSQRSGAQFQIVIDCLSSILAQQGENSSIDNLITFIRYDRSHADVTDMLSDRCDTRVLWGGDQAIDEIRKSPIPRDSIDVVFPDRTSHAVINASFWNNLDSQTQSDWLHRFFNDTLALDQLACSSPQTVLWVGSSEECDHARKSFWSTFEDITIGRDYEIDGATNVRKLATAWKNAMNCANIQQVERLEKTTTIFLDEDADANSLRGCGAGFFFDRRIESLSKIHTLTTSRDQTLTYAGFDRSDILELAHLLRGRGFSRFSPIGTALEFSHLWEADDLLLRFTRSIHVR